MQSERGGQEAKMQSVVSKLPTTKSRSADQNQDKECGSSSRLQKPGQGSRKRRGLSRNRGTTKSKTRCNPNEKAGSTEGKQRKKKLTVTRHRQLQSETKTNEGKSIEKGGDVKNSISGKILQPKASCVDNDDDNENEDKNQDPTDSGRKRFKISIAATSKPNVERTNGTIVLNDTNDSIIVITDDNNHVDVKRLENVRQDQDHVQCAASSTAGIVMNPPEVYNNFTPAWSSTPKTTPSPPRNELGAIDPCIDYLNMQERQDVSGSLKRLNFVFGVWGLTFDYETLSQLSTEEQAVMKTVKDFFQGLIDKSSLSELHSFLEAKPEQTVGKFIVGMTLLEYCLTCEKEVLYELYQWLQNQNEFFVDFVKSVLSFIVGRVVRLDDDGDIDVRDIPQAIMDNIDVSSNSYDTEFKKLGNIHGHLMEFIRLDLLQGTVKCLRKDLPALHIHNIWNNIAMVAVLQRIISPTSNMTNMIIGHDLKHHVTTVPFFTAIIGEKRIKVHLHQAIVGIFGCGIPSPETVVNASESDIDQLIKLLYKIDLPTEWQPKLSMGLLEAIHALQISNVWKFLVGDSSFNTTWEEYNFSKGNLIGIAVKSREENFFNQLGGNRIIEYLEKEDNARKSMKTYSAEDIAFLFSRIKQSLNPLQQYQLLLDWSFGASNQEMDSRNHPILEKSSIINEKVAEMFCKVMHLLNVTDMDMPTLKLLYDHNLYPRHVLYKPMKKLLKQ